jgi:phosphoglucomutase
MAAPGRPTRTASSRHCSPPRSPLAQGSDPGAALYRELTNEFGECVFDRTDARATPAQKALLSKLSAEQIKTATLAGEPIQSILTKAPGNNQAIGGVKVIAEHGWFAARPSGTEDLYKIYAESFRGAEHMQRIASEAEAIVTAALAAG